jgi:phage tail-like protein
MRPQGPTFWLLNGHTGWGRYTAHRDAGVSVGDTSGIRLAANPTGPLSLTSDVGDLGGLSLPRRLALDDEGTLYILGEDEPWIKRFDPATREFMLLPAVGGSGSEAREFRDPANIACAGRNLYVVDWGNRRIQVFDLKSLALRQVWEASPLLSKGDLKDPHSLAAKLCDAQDPLSDYLRGRLSSKVQQLLNRYANRKHPSGALPTALLDELNQILQGDPLYDEHRFAHVTLTEETQTLIARQPQGKQLVQLHRLLLEEAYPHEILKGLWEPCDVTTQADAAYILDRRLGRVYRHKPGTDTLRRLIDEAEAANRWTRIAVDREGRVYVLDPAVPRLEIYDSQGRRVGQAQDAGDVRDRFEPPPVRLDHDERFCLPGRLTSSALLRAWDLKSLACLAAKLRNARDLLSKYLRGRFSSDTQQLLDEYDGSAASAKALERALIDELNRQLQGGSLYDEQRFAGVELTEETRKLIKKEPKDKALVYLNRLLLEEAYPNEIAKGCLIWYGPQVVTTRPSPEIPLALCPPWSAASWPDGLIFDREGRPVPSVDRTAPLGPALYSREGTWISKPLDSETYHCQWHRLGLDLESLPAGTQVIVSTFAHETQLTTDYIQRLPEESWDTQHAIIGQMQPPPGTSTQSKPDHLHEFLVQSREGRYLWLRLILKGDGHGTPIVRAIRAHYPRSSYLAYLPAVFAADDESRWFLERFLSVFQTEWDDLERRIEEISRYFDPNAVPAGDALQYLARWLALPLEGGWDEEQKRRLLTAASLIYRQRGTIDGLRDYLRVYLQNITGLALAPEHSSFKITDQSLKDLKSEGVPDSVLRKLEIIRNQEIVGEKKLLGILEAVIGDEQTAKFKSVILNLASTEPLEYPQIIEGFRERQRLMLSIDNLGDLGQGAPLWGPSQVGRLQLDVFAREGEVRLVSTGDPERDLLHEYAHRFRVFVPAAWVRTAEHERMVRRALDAEKPAHTCYDLCLVEPRFRVGLQSTVGLDTIIGAYPAARLACPHEMDAPPSRPPRHRLGYDTILAGESAADAGMRLTPSTRVGIDTILT